MKGNKLYTFLFFGRWWRHFQPSSCPNFLGCASWNHRNIPQNTGNSSPAIRKYTFSGVGLHSFDSTTHFVVWCISWRSTTPFSICSVLDGAPSNFITTANQRDDNKESISKSLKNRSLDYTRNCLEFFSHFLSQILSLFFINQKLLFVFQYSPHCDRSRDWGEAQVARVL